ncbi:hypothetical protein CsSME_00053659 [Camellia sinensis var. sinensis]
MNLSPSGTISSPRQELILKTERLGMAPFFTSHSFKCVKESIDRVLSWRKPLAEQTILSPTKASSTNSRYCRLGSLSNVGIGSSSSLHPANVNSMRLGEKPWKHSCNSRILS